MPRDGFKMSRLGVLAPAALSACIDGSVLAVPAAGAIVSTVLKGFSKAFMLKKWFHGSMSAKEAENLLMEKGKSGSYLVRESMAHPGDFVLTVRIRGRVRHITIKKQDNKYVVGSGEQFDDLVDLIAHFRSHPMTESSGDVLRLLQPVNGTPLTTNESQKIQDIQQTENTTKLDSNNRIESEFESLQRVDNSNCFTSIEGLKPENLCKNRYKDIIPYDQTRVVLRRRNDRVGGDYINANYIRNSQLYDSYSSVQSSNQSLDSIHSLSFIPGLKKKRDVVPLVSKSLSEDTLKDVKRRFKLDKINGNLCKEAKDKMYIATQGCLSSTKDDFWRMIWQEDVRIIVMITNEYEKGKKKCEKYWPPSRQESNYDGLIVKTASEIFYEDYILREIDIRDESNTLRTVYQYQFTAWPDHSTPAMPDGLISFIGVVNKRLEMIAEGESKPEKNIICVHCSAGVGRTGTFIVLDMLINKIKNTGYNCDIDVRDTVQLVRSQRSGMVQNRTQYKFIYHALQLFVEERHLRRTGRVYSIEM